MMMSEILGKVAASLFLTAIITMISIGWLPDKFMKKVFIAVAIPAASALVSILLSAIAFIWGY